MQTDNNIIPGNVIFLTEFREKLSIQSGIILPGRILIGSIYLSRNGNPSR
jgi:hypothetical protein